MPPPSTLTLHTTSQFQSNEHDQNPQDNPNFPEDNDSLYEEVEVSPHQQRRSNQKSHASSNMQTPNYDPRSNRNGNVYNNTKPATKQTHLTPKNNRSNFEAENSHLKSKNQLHIPQQGRFQSGNISSNYANHDENSIYEDTADSNLPEYVLPMSAHEQANPDGRGSPMPQHGHFNYGLPPAGKIPKPPLRSFENAPPPLPRDDRR